MKKVVLGCFLCIFFSSAPVIQGDGVLRPATTEEKNFYASVVVPTLKAVQKAMPPAPEGWIKESESSIAPSLPEQISGEPGRFQYSYTVSYKRIEGVADEMQQFNEAYAESLKTHTDSAKIKLDELEKKMTQIDADLEKARKQKAVGRENRLKKDFEEINLQMQQIPNDFDQAIIADTEPFLVKDTAITITVSINDQDVLFPGTRAFSRPRSAFALRKEGDRDGFTTWRESRSIILYGDWQEVRPNVFHANYQQPPFSSRVRTVVFDIVGDAKRVDQFLKKMAVKDIVGMMN